MKIIRLYEQPNPYRKRSIPAAELRLACDAAIDLLSPLRLLGSLLSPAQRAAYGSRIDLDCDVLVRAVARGLSREPGLFPDVTLPGDELATAQDEADAARRLWRCLSYYAELAHDHYLAAQAECATAGRQVVRMVHGAPPDPGGLRLRRLVALGPAPRLWGARGVQIRRGQKIARQQRQPVVKPG